MSDIKTKLVGLHREATIERSHYYVGIVVQEALETIESQQAEIQRLQSIIKEMQQVDYVLAPQNEIDAKRYRRLKTFMLPEVTMKVKWIGSLSDWTPDKERCVANYETWEILERSLDEDMTK